MSAKSNVVDSLVRGFVVVLAMLGAVIGTLVFVYHLGAMVDSKLPNEVRAAIQNKPFFHEEFEISDDTGSVSCIMQHKPGWDPIKFTLPGGFQTYYCKMHEEVPYPY